ncbi:MAG: S41 family peptidase [Planctomycetia bacterium]|nr:S41 family peptidase [Planctomycetia bacterium]
MLRQRMVVRFAALVSTALVSTVTMLGVLFADEPKPPVKQPATESKPAESKPAEKKSAEKAKSDDGDAAKDEEYYELYKVFSETMFQVEQNYVKKVDRRKLMEAAIRGLLDELDPYSNFIGPKEIDRFKSSVESQFGGIGIQISHDDGDLRVLSPLVGSPAYLAGLEAGDHIIEVDGKPTEGLSLDEAVRKLKGEPGTKVKLTVMHVRSRKRETLTIERKIIEVETVLGDARGADDRWNFMLDPEKKIGYVRLTSFSRDTAEDLEAAMKTLKSQGLKGLVIDLRFNPGGLLKSAIEISDMFVSEGKIVSTKGRNTVERPVVARKAGTYEGFPIAVLVNRYSASASEIVSACLQDHKRAIVVGERTWGKGSVQNVIDLEDGHSALKLTTAAYMRPSGQNIHRFPDSKETDEWGVMPDKGYELKLGDSELSDLVRVRRDRDLLLVSHSPAISREESKPRTVDADDDSKDAPKKEAKEDKSDPKTESKKPVKAAPGALSPADPKKKEFIDRQLQKALEYLSNQSNAQAKAE